uniref:Autophagy-related protein 2 n=1 Tax=Psilocybe cubensis TaxID=181762 RepID=A0A8H7Y1H7_PSICU
MSWYSSWIPGLPSFNFSIPSGIQGRFLSFVLKKALGHLLKPGQLDYHQIDSQIGSGYVQAINAYLDGLPISLHSGTISFIKARIPWPNPLASTLGFSLRSLHLVFHVIPHINQKGSEGIDLTESVVSVAESFIHQELSSGEEATLWQSFHHEAALHSSYDEDHSIPGGLDVPASAEETSHSLDSDPAGVSVFASLIERLLARFEFDVQDVKITLVHPDNISLTLFLDDVRYHTDSRIKTTISTAPPGSLVEGETRTLSVNGLTLSSRNLSSASSHTFFQYVTKSPEPRSPSVATSRPISRRSSQSSLDDAAQFMMSQSLAVLPPRPPSSTGSVSSSMYESAISTISSHKDPQETLPTTLTDAHSDVEEQDTVLAPDTNVDNVDEVLVSFGRQPINFSLTTPSPVTEPPEDDDNPFISSADPNPGEEPLRLSASIGVIACAMKPWQVDALLQLGKVIVPSVPSKSVSSNDSGNRGDSRNQFPSLRVNAQIRGIVVILVPPSPNEVDVTGYFEKPMTPPSLKHGCIRLHLDTLSASIRMANVGVEKSASSTSNPIPTVPETRSTDFTIADISIFLFRGTTGFNDETLSAFPLLLTDPYLSSQYPHRHIHPQSNEGYPILPNFEVIDWTNKESRSYGTKLSFWRCQQKYSKFKAQTLASPGKLKESHAGPLPAIRFLSRTKEDTGRVSIDQTTDIQIAPLNIRIDLECLLQPGGPLSFFEALVPQTQDDRDHDSLSSEDTIENDMHASTWNMAAKSKVAKGPNIFKTHDQQRSNKPDLTRDGNQSRITIKFPLIRLAVRSPPPRLNARSGTLVVDWHNIIVRHGAHSPRASARFANDNEIPSRNLDFSEKDTLLKIEFSRLVIACSMVGATTAFTFASLGALTDLETDNPEYLPSQSPPSLQPTIYVIKPPLSPSRATPTFALSIDIPAVHVDLSKQEFDALQYWVDDLSQLLERLSGRLNNESSSFAGDSKDVSLIGTFVRVMIPRTDSDSIAPRPFDIKASDIDVLVELNPDNKQQTILTLGVSDLIMENTDFDGKLQRSTIKLRFSTSTMPNLNTKETRIKLTVCGFTYRFYPDVRWISDLAVFAKNPPGTFESVIPSDRTRIFVKIVDGSVCLLAPQYPGSIVTYLHELDFSTDVVGDSRDSSFHISATSLALLAIDDTQDQRVPESSRSPPQGLLSWTSAGYALVAEVAELDTNVVNQLSTFPLWKVDINRIVLRLHLCADTLTAVTAFAQNLGSAFKSSDPQPPALPKGPAVVHQKPQQEGRTLMCSQDTKIGVAAASIEDLAFKKVPDVGPAPDMIYDDLPTNLDYLDESFGAAAGLREMVDEDLDEFDDQEIENTTSSNDPNVISNIGGETIKIFDAEGLHIVEDYFLTIPPENSGKPDFSLKILDSDFTLFLYDGYDWVQTRRTIEEEVKEMRKRLAKIRQLVANGQIQEPMMEDTSALLYNSVHIGLEDDEDLLGEPSALIAAIDEELKDDMDTASQSSWQSLRPSNAGGKSRARSLRIHGKKLTRAKTPSMEFCLAGVNAEFDQYQPEDPLVSRAFVTVKDLEILDHIKTSTWKKFLTELRSDSRGNIRETDSHMVRIELRTVRPVSGNSSEEARLRAKILPLRLYVDQDAVDFLKKFFSFKDPHAVPSAESQSDDNEAYIQLAEIFPIDLKLDYKPRRVDYRALKEGRTIELMNFFHFDGAEMTLRHITLTGVTGWPKLFEMLNDLWTPDVKATQLVEVISGVAPIRSMVNVGSGVADLILLPIAQYKKDGRIVRGMQKGATAFVKSTAVEAIRMGAKLATGTQVVLEQAEGVLGGQFDTSITAEPLQVPTGDEFNYENEEEEVPSDLISKYAYQRTDLREGVQSAYKSLQRNLSSAAQTILAVPMEVYERSGNEGPVRSVVRAVPIAVLKPMIGASEAVSKTLLGLHNTLDPNVRHENEAKYKSR